MDTSEPAWLAISEIEMCSVMWQTRLEECPSAYSVPGPLEAILKRASVGELVRRGQGTVEYMLTMSVISLAIVATLLAFDIFWKQTVSGVSETMVEESLHQDMGVQEP